MPCRVTQPTKEQVRAYMAARERAHRPPPAPEDIRRQLGWKMAPPPAVAALIDICLLPATTGHYLSQMVYAWCLVPFGALGSGRARQASKNPA